MTTAVTLANNTLQVTLTGVGATGPAGPAGPPGNSANAVYVSSYGMPSFSDDTATVLAAFNAAVAGGRRLFFDDPTGFRAPWYINNTIFSSGSAQSTPIVSSVNTTTGVVTFDRSHGITLAGDVIAFVGSNVGNAGGLGQLNAYQEYFTRAPDGVSVKLYDTKANALAGGATGLVVPNLGVNTTGVFNTATLASGVSSGATSVTVTDASKLVIGDRLNFSGSGATTFPKITGIAGNVLTVSPAVPGSFSSGATIYTSSMDVASTLAFEMGTTITVTNPTSSNFTGGSFIVLSISGLTIHLNQTANTGVATPGTVQNVTSGIWMAPEYGTIDFEMDAAPGVAVRKTAAFAGNEMFRFAYMNGVTIRNMEFWGKTTGYTPDPGLVPGDDGPRIFACNKTVVENCIFRNFGDSAIRTHSSSFWVGARSATYPTAGVYSNNIVVKDCYFLDIFQTSTTNSNSDYQGASRNVWYVNNTFRNVGGSIKFANRAPGSANIYLLNNVVEKAGRNGFELDSCDNYVVDGNTIENCKAYGVFLIANNLQPVGFAFNDARISNNVIKGGANSSTGGGIYVSTDTYPDGTLWDYRGLHIAGNRIYDLPAASTPIQIATGSFVGARIQDNLIHNCAAPTMMSLGFRAHASLRHDIAISGNIAKKCTGAKATFFSISPTNGAAGVYVRGVCVHDNQFDNTDVTLGNSSSNDGRFLLANYTDEMEVSDNFWVGPGATAVYTQNEGKNINVRDNDFNNTNSAAGTIINLTGMNGAVIRNNRFTSAWAGTSVINFDRTSQRVRISGNDIADSTNKTISAGNVPYKTGGDGLRREETLATAPTSGTWDLGDRYWLAAPGTGTSMGGVCTTAGSLSAISTTGDSTMGSGVIANVAAMTNIAIGCYVTHTGFAGAQRVTAMTANTVTLSGTAASTAAGGALAHSSPAFKAMPNIAA